MLWYTGSDGNGGSGRFPGARGFGLRVGAALSREGRRWVNLEGEGGRGATLGQGDGASWDSGRTFGPGIVRAADGRWRMYYLGADTTRERVQVGLATSADGLLWEKVGPVLGSGARTAFDASGPLSLSPLRRRNRFYLFYEGLDASGGRRIGLAFSEDGVRFNRTTGSIRGGAILEGGPPGAWDEGGVGLPSVVERPDGEVWMYYTGYGKEGQPTGIGVARCPGYDLARWEKVR